MRLTHLFALAVAAAALSSPAGAAQYRQEFDAPKAQVYQALVAALPDLKLKPVSTDARLARVTAKAGMSAFSVGENLSIAVVEISPTRSALELDGEAKATSLNAFAKDRVLGHFNRIVLAVSQRLIAAP